MEDTPCEETSDETISALQQMSIALYEDNTEYFKTVLSSMSPELVRIWKHIFPPNQIWLF